MIDFRAYYCASLAQRLGRDPYFTASVHECESKTPAPYYRAPKNVTVPAPYPPYALAFFAPLTFLPFAVAAILWWIALALSILLAAYALARIARQPMLVAWGALVLSLGLSSFWSGNVMPVAFAALIVAALAVQRGRLAIAVPALAIAMVEPQVALPAALGLFVACSRVRVALILAAARAWHHLGRKQRRCANALVPYRRCSGTCAFGGVAGQSIQPLDRARRARRPRRFCRAGRKHLVRGRVGGWRARRAAAGAALRRSVANPARAGGLFGAWRNLRAYRARSPWQYRPASCSSRRLERCGAGCSSH